MRANTEHHSLALYPSALRETLGLSPHTSLMSFGVQLANYRQLRDAVGFLRERGVQVRDLPPELSPGIDYSCLAIDPDGHAVQLYYYMQQLPPPGLGPCQRPVRGGSTRGQPRWRRAPTRFSARRILDPGANQRQFSGSARILPGMTVLTGWRATLAIVAVLVLLAVLLVAFFWLAVLASVIAAVAAFNVLLVPRIARRLGIPELAIVGGLLVILLGGGWLVGRTNRRGRGHGRLVSGRRRSASGLAPLPSSDGGRRIARAGQPFAHRRPRTCARGRRSGG